MRSVARTTTAAAMLCQSDMPQHGPSEASCQGEMKDGRSAELVEVRFQGFERAEDVGDEEPQGNRQTADA